MSLSTSVFAELCNFLGQLGTYDTNDNNIGKCLEKISSFTNRLEECYDEMSQFGHLFSTYPSFVSEFKDLLKLFNQDERLKYSVKCLYVLQCFCTLSVGTEDGSFSSCNDSKINLLSIPQLKGIEVATRIVLYNLYLISLNENSSLYLIKNAKVSRINFFIYSDLKMVNLKRTYDMSDSSKSASFPLALKLVLKVILQLYKIESVRLHLQRVFFIEILIGLLQLCFCPIDISVLKDDVPQFREHLEFLVEKTPKEVVLSAILLLEGLLAHKEAILKGQFGTSLEENIGVSAINSQCEISQTSITAKEKNWLKTVCQSIFTRRFLLKDGGLKIVLATLRTRTDLSVGSRKEAIASVVSSCRLRGKASENEDEFYRLLCPQILEIFMNDSNDSVETFQILAFVVSQLDRRSPALSQTHFFKPLFKPLVSLTYFDDKMGLPKSESLTSTVTTLYRLFFQCLPHVQSFSSILESILCPLFEISALPATCHVKTKAQLILVRYLSNKDVDEAVHCLMIIFGLEVNQNFPSFKSCFQLTPRLDQIEIKVSSTEEQLPEEEEAEDRRLKSWVDILEKLKQPLVVRQALRALTSYLDFTVLNLVEISENHLLTSLDILDIQKERMKKLTTSVSLLHSICDSDGLSSDLFSDFSSAVPIISNLLETQNQQCTDPDLLKTRESFLVASVMTLSYFVSDQTSRGKITRSDWLHLKDIVPSLRQLMETYENAALAIIGEQLLNSILSRGAISSSDPPYSSTISPPHSQSSQAAKTTPTKNAYPQDHPSTENSSYSCSTNESKSKNNSSTDFVSASSNVSTYNVALTEICSPHLPVRGHALISLTKLLEAKDPKTMENKEKVLGLFEHHLRDEDSYIYLAAIEGIVVLTSNFPDKVVTLITDEFSAGHQTVETRLKLTEILTKTVGRLGPVLPKFKSVFLNCLLNGAKDSEPLIRAASLSNLGEVCKELRFSVQSVLHEIFYIVESAIDVDKSPEVKRSAVLLVSLLLQGLGNDCFKVLESVLLRIYRSLKLLISTSDDSVLVLQAQLAMDEINTLTKSFLLPKLNMTKKIFITDLPSSDFG